MKYKFHASCTDYYTYEVEADSLEVAQEIAEKSDGGDWSYKDSGGWDIDHDLTETKH